MDAFHLAMLACAGLLVIGTLVFWFGLRAGPSPGGSASAPAAGHGVGADDRPSVSRGPGTARRGRG